MKKTIAILIAIIIGLGVNCFAQGQVTRAKKSSTTNQHKPANSKPVNQAQNDMPLTEDVNEHDWVDLGLPSGLKWATCNVGASKPEDYGDYFAWGETGPKSEYSKYNSLTYGKSVSTLQSKGIINSSGILTRNYDAASANWGETWRMPTDAEYDELINSCRWTWITQGGKNGYKVTGPNGNSIFLPIAGFRFNRNIGCEGSHGAYWCSSIYDDSSSARDCATSRSRHSTLWSDRYYGCSVRPVSE